MMNSWHDPRRQVDYLEQCLASDKRPLGLFLGAGGPTAVKVGAARDAPLIPDIAGLTAHVLTSLTMCEVCGPLAQAVSGHLSADGNVAPTVEHILTHIRGLRAVAGTDRVRGLAADDLARLDERTCDLIHRIADQTLPRAPTPYHSVASWVAAVRRQHPVQVFTTNYDLLMEQALEEIRVPYFDGFAGARRPLFDLRAVEEDDLPPRWARLWKLHGSVNWFADAEKGVFRAVDSADGAKRVIHPSHLKYHESRRMPYLAMIDRLRAFLRLPTSTLIVSGYSFRDQHLNEVILQGLEASQTAVAFALLYGPLDQYPEAIALARARPNLNALAQDRAVVGGQVAGWPIYDVETVPSDGCRWVRWEPTTGGDPGKVVARLDLGDFVELGHLLDDLVGTMREGPEPPHV